MGGWQLEVGKMALYMAFPVGMFHYFNQPQYFEKWVRKCLPKHFFNLSFSYLVHHNFHCHPSFPQVTETKRELYPPESKSHRSEIEVKFLLLFLPNTKT